jgi:hypothetical protein
MDVRVVVVILWEGDVIGFRWVSGRIGVNEVKYFIGSSKMTYIKQIYK